MYRDKELYKNRVHEEAVAMERVNFTKTDRTVNPLKVNPFLYQVGNIPILITAPHSVRYKKQKKIRVSDEFTGATALILNKLTGCHILAVSKLYGGDPNSDRDCIFKDCLAKILQNNDIKYVIDLHGCGRETGIDVSVETYDELINKKYLKINNELICTLREYYEKVEENYFEIEKNSVTEFVSNNFNVASFQIEINKKYRVPHQNGQSYCRMIDSLVSAIELLKY